MKLFLAWCVIPAIFCVFGIIMAMQRAKEILMERYGELVEQYYSPSRIDVIMSWVKFAILSFCPVLNMAVGFICIFGYGEICDKTVERVVAEIERNLRNAEKE